MLGSITDTLATNPVLLLFVVVAAGFAFGRLRVGGFSLGVAAVLFAGIGAGALDTRLKLPEEIWVLGLALFVYTVGLASGPGFIAAMRRRGLTANAVVVTAIVASSLVAVGANQVLGLSGERTAGSFAGGETNTPALAAALDVLKGKTGFDTLAADPIVGYSLAYPLGVVLPLLVVWLALRRRRRYQVGDSSGMLVSGTILVERESGTLDELRERHGVSISFGRLKQGEDLVTAVGRLTPQPGDLLSVVGTAEEISLIEHEIGRRASEAIDLDKQERDSRRIVISSRAVAGRQISDLDLEHRYDATATRLRRGDIDVVAYPSLQLELGDAIRIVAPPARMREIARFFGDSFRALGEVDVLTFSFGIAAGLAVGALPLPLPGGGTFSLGSAGGPLLVGLALGAIARTGPFVWQLPYTANLTLRQFGMMLFLAGIGTRSGHAFADAIVKPSALVAIAAGAAITLTALVVLLIVGGTVLHLPTSTLIGMLAGMQTQPAVLAFATDQLEDDRELTLGYASVYPMAMITKIVVAQILIAVLVR